MAKLFPSKQTVVDHIGNTTIIVSTVKIVNATSDHLDLPNAVDASILTATYPEAAPTFYLASSGRTFGNQFAIDGAVVGTVYTVVSRHEGSVNAQRGQNTPGTDNVL